MAGHSKWKQIKHAKAVTDQRRGKLFTKLAREIIVASQQGGGDPDANFRLRMAIQHAKDNIDRAIKRGTGEGGDGVQMIEAVYEGYGPGGVAIMLETLSDNRNRTVSAVRTTLTRAGGNLAEAGAVSWQFEKRGVITIEADDDEADDLALVAIDAGAEDVDTDDSILQVYSEPSTLEDVRSALESSDASISSSEVSLIPSHTVTLDTRMAGQILRLLDQLEEIDDVQQVYSNADFPDEALANYEG
ncbi:MAG: YebC/PmpR family DNA-binding transcriptional regulator [Dehalococcoidia bacterium]|nr:YebC/PmpR family DNA-binding transcriptional regulator [Dehalococcoidia bacterium]